MLVHRVSSQYPILQAASPRSNHLPYLPKGCIYVPIPRTAIPRSSLLLPPLNTTQLITSTLLCSTMFISPALTHLLRVLARKSQQRPSAQNRERNDNSPKHHRRPIKGPKERRSSALTRRRRAGRARSRRHGSRARRRCPGRCPARVLGSFAGEAGAGSCAGFH